MKNRSIKYCYQVVFALMLTLVSTASFSQEYLDMRIPHQPKIVPIKGIPMVYYELHLANFGRDSVILNQVKIIDEGTNTAIFSIKGEELSSRVGRISISDKEDNKILPPGMMSLVYVELPAESSGKLVHQVEFESLRNGQIASRITKGGHLILSKQQQLILGAPLRNGPWVAIYDPSWARGHRRVVYTVSGQARIPGRFAIDFIKLNHQGKTADGDDDFINNWFGYGADVLAVADGTVASVKDDFPESETRSKHPAYTSDQATGNYISIDMGNGYFVFYEHLKPGSIKVKPGQRVKKGDIIGALGFTGQATSPHLHFHVANRNSPLGAEGIPFSFENFKVLGEYPDFEKFGKEKWKNCVEQETSDERPSPNSVITFE